MKYIGEGINYNPTTMEETGRHQIYDMTGEWTKTHRPGLVERIAHKVSDKFKEANPRLQHTMAVARTKIDKMMHPEDKTLSDFPIEEKEGVINRVKQIIAKWPKN